MPQLNVFVCKNDDINVSTNVIKCINNQLDILSRNIFYTQHTFAGHIFFYCAVQSCESEMTELLCYVCRITGMDVQEINYDQDERVTNMYVHINFIIIFMMFEIDSKL